MPSTNFACAAAAVKDETSIPWIAGTACVASDYHSRDGADCQDAASAGSVPRAFAAVFDGRGSSELSQQGSRAAAAAMPRIVEALDPILRRALDEVDADETLWPVVGKTVLRLLRGEQRQVAHALKVPVAELEFTVSLAITGAQRLGVIQLGDSATVVGYANGQVQLGAARQQGEAACETVFLGDYDGSIAVADFALLPAADVVALLCISDGVADGWLDAATGSASPGVTRVIERLRTGSWSESDLLNHFQQPIWRKLQDDDRGVAYCVQTIDPQPSCSASDPILGKVASS